MPARSDTPASTPERVLPGIMQSADLAAILTPILWEMVTEARAKADREGFGRYMAEPLNAITGLVVQVRKYHGLPAFDPHTGQPVGTAVNGTAPVPEEVTS